MRNSFKLVLGLLLLVIHYLNRQRRWKRLLNLCRSGFIGNLESVGKSRSTNLELGHSTRLFNVDNLDVLSASSHQKLLDFFNFLWLFKVSILRPFVK
jgi:hypothetical protein